MIDVNVHLHRWPFRRLKGDELSELVAKLRSQKVAQAWAGSFDALLHRDLGDVNRRLAADCAAHAGLLLPFGSVNPLLPDWEEELRRCHEGHRMRGLRLYPNYHGYRLDGAAAASLLKAAAERALVVQIAVRMEDERTQHPLLRVAPVDLAPLPRLLAEAKGLRLVLLNGSWNPEQIRSLTSAGDVSCDVAMVEGVGGVGKLPADRLLFGSHYPFFYHEAASLKVREAAPGAGQERAILADNARRLLAPK